MGSDAHGYRRIVTTAADLIPERATLPQLRERAAGCTACDLWRNATQTVFGEGPRSARLMLVGEQPGDVEDREGRPFVGPAGSLLDRALDDAGADRSAIYVSNVVKHFKWRARGPRRIHDTPNEREVAACRPWLQAEIAAVRPRVLVCLGATAARSLLGPSFRLTRHRGELVESELGPLLTATYHPSAVLRAPRERRSEVFGALVEDLGAAVRAAA